VAEITQTVVQNQIIGSAVAVRDATAGTAAPVRKIGRTTGITKGTLCVWNCDMLADMSFGTFYFEGPIGSIGHGPGPFAAPGDSGAVGIAKFGNKSAAVCLVMARAYCSGAYVPSNLLDLAPGFVGYIVLMCPMMSVLAALAPLLGVKPGDIQFRMWSITRMALIVSSRSDRGVAIFQPQGKLTLGPALHAFRERVDQAIGDPCCVGIVLNLAQVPAMDSAGIGELVAIHSTAARRRLRIALVQPSPRLKDVLVLTRADALFSFNDDESSAVATLLSMKDVA
jgi:anti-anti-sigma factor